MERKVRQLIIVRKDLNMSPGKLAAQCCHASLAFMSKHITEDRTIHIDEDIYNNWFNDIFTKTILEAKNLNQLLRVKEYASQVGLVENKDFYIVKDRCLTELEPEEYDDQGIGWVTTCIGFKPLEDDVARVISRKYQLYH